MGPTTLVLTHLVANYGKRLRVRVEVLPGFAGG
jgi:hypothetical protein